VREENHKQQSTDAHRPECDYNHPMNAETVVTFIPGAAGLGNFWKPVAERLPASWETQLIDLPGLGSIPSRADVSSYSDLVDYVARGIAGPTVLVGQSMGGFIALQLALRYPHLVTHLVLAVVAGGVDMDAHGARDWRTDDAPSSLAQTWANDAVPDLTQQLGAIEVPVLLVWATRDAWSPLSVAQTLASRIPRASLVTFDSDHHWIARKRADEIAAAVRSFVEAER
jgi:poly(3-hydroxyoctanoate) depolymerase